MMANRLVYPTHDLFAFLAVRQQQFIRGQLV